MIHFVDWVSRQDSISLLLLFAADLTLFSNDVPNEKAVLSSSL